MTDPPHDSALSRFRELREVRAVGASASGRAERQLILLSAATATLRSRAGVRARRLASEVEWMRLTETLRMRRLLPTLGPRIIELAGEEAEEGFAFAVTEAVESGRRQGALLQLVCARAIGDLADAGIRAAALKGPLLAEAIYGDVGRRISSDVDLLVDVERLGEAVDVVRAMGYGAPGDYVENSGLPSVHFALTHERGELPPIEIHWRMHWYERSFARERLLPPKSAHLDGWRPAPADELAMLLLFYSRDGFVDLRLASDLSAWWDVFGSEVRVAAVNEVLHAYPQLARSIVAAAFVAEATVGVPASRIVGEESRLRLRDRMAIRLANPNPRSRRSQLHADMGLIDWLLIPPGGFRAFVRRQVLLPREVFDALADQIPDWRSRSPLRHAAHTLARYGLAMMRLVRRPETLEDRR